MDSSFLTLPPPYEHLPTPPSPTSSEHPRGRRGRSPSFLNSVKTMMQQPLKRMLSPGRSPGLPPEIVLPSQNSNLSDGWVPHNQSRPRPTSSRHSHCGYHTGSCEHSCHACHRPSTRQGRSRREPIPSMADYLTLSQLEDVWRGQDTYKGCVEMPRRTHEIALQTTRTRTEDQETAYQANLRVHPNYSKPRHHRSYSGMTRWENYGSRPEDITEYYGKR